MYAGLTLTKHPHGNDRLMDETRVQHAGYITSRCIGWIQPFLALAQTETPTRTKLIFCRHLTEFNGLDLEMSITDHYNEVIAVLHNTFKVRMYSIISAVV